MLMVNYSFFVQVQIVLTIAISDRMSAGGMWQASWKTKMSTGSIHIPNIIVIEEIAEIGDGHT